MVLFRFVTAAALVSSLSAPAVLPDWQNPPSTIAAAVGKLQSGDAAGAVTILEAIVKREPDNGRASRTLGQAYQASKNLDGAEKAYRHALEIEPAMPMPLFNLGVIAAIAGRTDEAFSWLTKARDTRKIDMTQLDVTPSLARLKTDPRFAALRPTPASFENPFVEDVRVLREWRGEAAGDQFGWIARNLGDVDGDGVADVVTSAPSHAVNGAANAGRVYVYSSRSGRLLWTADGKAEDQLGTGVEAAGDTNGDGIPDVIASAPGSERAFIYSGRDGKVLQTLHGETDNEGFGSHTAGVGDVNGDGCADVIVGAPGGRSRGAVTGRAYVFSGKGGRLMKTLTGDNAGDAFGAAVTGYSRGSEHLLVIGAGKGGPKHAGKVYVYRNTFEKTAFTLDADATGKALGAMFVAVPGDVDGDGVVDVFASDWSNASRGDRTGRAYVLSGKTGHVLFTFDGQTAGEGFGTSASVAGDVDGDGHADLIVGAWQYSGAALSGGRAYLYSGRDGRLLKTYTCRTPGDTFGFDAVTLGDIDRDGMDDFLITSGWSGVSGNHSGRVFVIASGVKKSSGPQAAPAARADSPVTLATIPARVSKISDSGKFDTECWYFDLVVSDAAGRALEPVAATIELMSKQHTLKRTTLDAEGLKAIRRARYTLTENVPKASPRRHFSMPEAFDLGLYFSEPRLSAIDGVRVTLTATDAAGNDIERTIDVPVETYVQQTKLIFPLRGPAIVTQGRFNQGGHVNRSTMYAMDVMGVSDTNYGPMIRNEDVAEAIVGWGQEVLAPADGIVTYARNDAPANRTLYETDVAVFSALPDPVWASNGNCVVIDHGNGEFSALLHMQPGSVMVKIGDRVAQGQAIGKLGNSGDSNMPHLHYQLMNGPVMFVADGLPFRFDNLKETTFAPGTYLTRRSKMNVRAKQGFRS
jgi:hypothetical protein